MCEGPWTKHIKDQRPGLVRRAMVNFRGAVPIGRLPWGVWEPSCPMHTHRYATCTPHSWIPHAHYGIASLGTGSLFQRAVWVRYGLGCQHLSSILNSTSLFL